MTEHEDIIKNILSLKNQVQLLKEACESTDKQKEDLLRAKASMSSKINELNQEINKLEESFYKLSENQIACTDVVQKQLI